MIVSLVFCAGIVVGLAASVPIVAIFWLGAHKLADIKVKSQLTAVKVDAMQSKKRLDESIKKLRMLHPDMTSEQEAIAIKELVSNGDIFQARYRS